MKPTTVPWSLFRRASKTKQKVWLQKVTERSGNRNLSNKSLFCFSDAVVCSMFHLADIDITRALKFIGRKCEHGV